MKQKLEMLLAGGSGNHILPFYWQHGEDEATIRDMMRAIHECGIGSVCIECRPHPDFCGPQWWKDMDIIMDEARTRGMKVWLLDDAHFPTGYANGAMADADPALCKQYIAKNTLDVLGPNAEVEINIAEKAKYRRSPFGGAQMMGPFGGKQRTFDDDTLLCVLAVSLEKNTKFSPEVLDLTDQVVDGMLYWKVPNGAWRVYVIYMTKNGGGRTDYINVLDEASCRVQIEQCYEPHYQHYRDDFGKTFLGFFSDEPLLGNTFGFDWTESIGKHPTMNLPWSKDVPAMLEERLGKNWLRTLPMLWADSRDDAVNAKVRYAYMDTVTRLVEKNFSRQIGDWCQARGVEYIGHIVEDNNQHNRLGSSMGHFFRALAGQHMSGIDDIGGQVYPNGEDFTRRGLPEDGEFYHFALGKLGSSYGNIDPRKKGRTMCEIFGAYGWNESVPMMKYLADHFMVRGVNNYVPHAFTGKAFPDPDCPPHFYAHGENPQYRHFGKLCRYMNRVCELISDGKHVAPAAVLYHGEAEWSGRYMFLQKPARVLLENQIDFDILPSDLFADMEPFHASFQDTLQVNGIRYQTLIIPYAQYVTKAVAEFAGKASAQGFPVIFLNGLPEGICDPCAPEEAQALIQALRGCTVLTLDTLAEYLRSSGIFDIQLSSPFRRLRYYHYRNNGDLYMLTNEDAGESWSGTVTLPITGELVAYDAMENVLRPVTARPVFNGTEVDLTVEPYQSVLITNAAPAGTPVPQPLPQGTRQVIAGPWKLSLAEAKEYPDFHDEQKLEKLRNVGRLYPNFSGFMRYETEIQLTAGKHTLEASEVYDCAELYVNGKPAGMRICPPYRWDISDLVRDGANQICIDVANTLDRKVRAISSDDPMMGMFGANPLDPSGIVGDVAVFSAI